ncbi:MAG: AGE family epimerase/isomerase [Pyrinomonadaceae bacterium]|nr:AGE family epimerase/isomerase [Phycisphaerales bacterium]
MIHCADRARRVARVLTAFVAMAGCIGMAHAGDEVHVAKAREAARKGIAYLRGAQDKETGGWSVPKAPGSSDPKAQAAPAYPAISSLVLMAMLADGQVKTDDPAVQSGVKYILNFQQPDGGVYDRVVPTYNTSIALSAFAKIGTPQVKGAMTKAQEFLKRMQWSETSAHDEGLADTPSPVGKEHPYYGGVGYGRSGRPDMSNLGMMLQALHDSGVSPDDESVQRAMTFLHRTQMLDGVNDMPYAKGSRQGGFIYATVPNAQSVDGRAGQSQATEMVEETMDDGTKVSRLRCYGSMTYAGFKSYIYAAIPKDDPRVKAAYGWITRNYTVEENPGVGQSGLYYYYVTMSKALSAWGEPTIEAIGTDGKAATRRWSADLIDKLVSLQNEDGSFKSVDKRWMEDNAVMITAFALIALGEAEKMEAKK